MTLRSSIDGRVPPMSDEVTERIKRWDDLAERIQHSATKDMDFPLTSEQRLQLFVCMGHWLANFQAKHQPTIDAVVASIERFGQRVPPATLTNRDLMLAASAAEWVLYEHDKWARHNQADKSEPFACGSFPKVSLSRQVLIPVCDRLYAALGGGILPGHYKTGPM